ncbi:ABC transporter ATP-binding protein [Thermaerobacter sp. FW80]|nr:ABC transporter ATP-binding protein [Thermaerobacter sp. FW80]
MGGVYLEAIRLEKRYGWRPVLRNVSLGAGPGILAVVGPNGAGKTTLLRVLAGVLPPSRGCVRWQGREIADDPAAYRWQMGYKPQDLSVYPGQTVAAALRYLARLKGIPDALVDERVTEVAEEWGLASVASRPLATLSRGWRQRFFLAQALLADPDILILDEPAVALDECGRQQLFRRLRLLARERVVIVGGHGLRELTEVADRVLVLKRGTVRFLGTPSQLAAWAAGWVWELCLPPGDPALERLRRRFVVTGRRDEPARAGQGRLQVLRLLARRRPHPAAAPVEPGPVEGYLRCIADEPDRPGVPRRLQVIDPPGRPW